MRPEPRWPSRGRIELNGKRVLLTGSSSGIGEAAAEKFAAAGAEVILVARRRDRLVDLVDRIKAEGGKAIAIPTNLVDEYAVADLLDVCGPVDILVNNAARSIRRPLAESLERWHDVERIMDLNFYAPLRLIRGLAPGMIERGDGHIINVGSWRVLPEASPLFGPYIASKAALSAVSRVIENEWGARGVHSTTLFYPQDSTPMSGATDAYQGVPAITSVEAADWMLTAARRRPVRIAPRMAVAARALDVVSPRLLNRVMTPEAFRLPDQPQLPASAIAKPALGRGETA